jgi:electron-transferring-flavoprotein dehydrogenase
MRRFRLRDGVDPQTYAIGIKELWELDANRHRPGTAVHTLGWPLDPKTYGGSFMYHAHDRQLAVGFVVGLDYRNPFLNPFEEFQRFKTHPAVVDVFRGARRIAFGARALSEGGFQSIPKLAFPGGLLAGDAAGFLDVPRLKGIHHAMKSGMLAAESVLDSLQSNQAGGTTDFDSRFRRSSVHDRLYRARNIRPSFRWGLFAGLAYSAFDSYLLRGRAPWTLRYRPDHRRLARAGASTPIDYPKPDGEISFDIPSSLYLANIRHEENQPCHLKLRDPNSPIFVNLALYNAPEQRYCPAGVYEIVRTDEHRVPRLQINAENCIHCKTCDIKDPTQNIFWSVPNGGDGPNYAGM